MSAFEFVVDEVRTFSYPDGVKRILAEVPIRHLPGNFPTEVNARSQNLRTGVARAIRRSLRSEDTAEVFHLLNRGIVVTVERVEFDSKTRRLRLTMPDKELHGVLDGGHTYRIVTEEASAAPNARVLLEILSGVEDFQADIVGARNTSVQVDAATLANVRREFEPILAHLDKHGISRDRIRVRQNEDKEIPILDILAIMYLFDVDSFGNDVDGLDRPPILAYTGKGSVLKHFQSPEHIDVFTSKMLPLLPDILYLWDYVALRIQDHYRVSTGRLQGRVGRRRGNEAHPIDGTYMPHLNLEHIPHRAYRLPLMAAMRSLVDDTGDVYRWRDVNLPPVSEDVERLLRREATPVERLYEHVAPKLHRVLWTEAEQATPNKLGKQATLWNNLYMIAWRELQGHR